MLCFQQFGQDLKSYYDAPFPCSFISVQFVEQFLLCAVGLAWTKVIQHKFPNREVHSVCFRFSIKSNPKQPLCYLRV